jgi:hypothetical protein
MSDMDLNRILVQLQEGKKLQEPLSEKHHGEIRYYFYDVTEENFYCRRIDSVLGSYNLLIKISKDELKQTIDIIGPDELKNQGFKLNQVVNN